MTKVVRVSDKKMSLEDVQKMVGGYIQEVHVSGSDDQHYVNEEGLLYDLLPNPEGSRIVGQPIVGDLVILSGIAKLTQET